MLACLLAWLSLSLSLLSLPHILDLISHMLTRERNGRGRRSKFEVTAAGRSEECLEEANFQDCLAPEWGRGILSSSSTRDGPAPAVSIRPIFLYSPSFRPSVRIHAFQFLPFSARRMTAPITALSRPITQAFAYYVRVHGRAE